MFFKFTIHIFQRHHTLTCSFASTHALCNFLSVFFRSHCQCTSNVMFLFICLPQTKKSRQMLRVSASVWIFYAFSMMLYFNYSFSFATLQLTPAGLSYHFILRMFRNSINTQSPESCSSSTTI